MSLLNKYRVPYNKVTLQFKDRNLENEFVKWRHHTKVHQLRWAFFLVTFLYFFYTFAEQHIVSSKILQTAQEIHLFIVIPVVMFNFLISFYKPFDKYYKYSAIIAVLIAALCNLYLVTTTGLEGFYTVELYLMIFWIFNVAGFRLITATVVSLTIICMACISAIYFVSDGLNYSYCFWLINSFALAFLGGHLVEYLSKVNFLKEKKLHEEINERLRAQGKLRYAAHHDALTQLANRTLLLERMEVAQSEKMFSWMLIDLDKFKTVNDTFGHHAGDVLLQTVAKRLLHTVRDSDTVCRYGGDEFIILLCELSTKEDAIQIAKKIKEQLAAPYHLDEYGTVHISASIGLTFYPEDGKNSDELYKHADMAMYCAKNNGGNQIHIYDGVSCE